MEKGCPRCSKEESYRLGDGRRQCQGCRYKYSTRREWIESRVLEMFCLEVSARKASQHLGLSYKTVYRRYSAYRRLIAQKMLQEFRRLGGEIECDESYFGGKRKGPRGRGSLGKRKVFGILERNGKVYVTVVPKVDAPTLMQQIREKTHKGSVFYTDSFRSYNSLRQYGKHLAVDHGREFAKGPIHINGIEGFWSFAKERLAKYHGVDADHFELYLKEQEFRYNYRHDLFRTLQNWLGPDFT